VNWGLNKFTGKNHLHDFLDHSGEIVNSSPNVYKERETIKIGHMGHIVRGSKYLDKPIYTDVSAYKADGIFYLLIWLS